MARPARSRSDASNRWSSRLSTRSAAKHGESSRHAEPTGASEKRIVRRSSGSARHSRTDWERIGRLTDEEIERAVAADPDAAPILDDEWLAQAELRLPPEKELISIRIDKDVLSFFRSLGPRYQTRMNAVLRAFIERAKLAEKRSSGRPKRS